MKSPTPTPGARTQNKVSSGAAGGQGGAETVLPACTGSHGSCEEEGLEGGRRLRAQQGGWTGAWLERAGLDQGYALSREEGPWERCRQRGSAMAIVR